jgi:hypothetical protein
MANYVQYVDQHLASVRQQQESLQAEAGSAGSPAITGGSFGSVAAAGGAGNDFLGYSLCGDAATQPQVVRGRAALLLQADKYYAELKLKAEIHLGQFLNASQSSSRGFAPGTRGAYGQGGGQLHGSSRRHGSRAVNVEGQTQGGGRGRGRRGRGWRAGGRRRGAHQAFPQATADDWRALGLDQADPLHEQ